ncbi:response regulator transcription factor [Halomonas daqiaonensis]|uniref:Two-component system, OmpR family, KDP operon response regulator KdpE n=1 Tax=Halomonas daqiaonensis TaxID=650850 RepID=A0A1H7MKJ8_9GAMM|nr:response regulator transcription factor [Halomonas daqiaonensis]SEL11631.1 two-component system, OmpR family, KDP operon response regulator KdpE [Halomonas daqiaonensis]
MSTEPQRILVIDDEPQIRRFLRISLVSQGFVVYEAASGHEGLELALKEIPSLVLLDLGLPDMDGQSVLDRLRARSQVPIVVVSVRGQEAEKVRALDHGANDYMTKPFGIRELLARIRALLRLREAPQGSPEDQRYRNNGLVIDPSERRVCRDGMPVHLTPKEYAVLERLCRHSGRVVTQTQLLREVWGPSHAEDTHYLRIVISKLRQKLGDDSGAQSLLQTEAGIGYRLMIEPENADDPAEKKENLP